MLTDLLFALPVRVQRWLVRRLGIGAGLHSWMDAMCPCEEHR